VWFEWQCITRNRDQLAHRELQVDQRRALPLLADAVTGIVDVPRLDQLPPRDPATRDLKAVA